MNFYNFIYDKIFINIFDYDLNFRVVILHDKNTRKKIIIMFLYFITDFKIII